MTLSFLEVEPVKILTFKSILDKDSLMLIKCCWAKISVGAIKHV